MYKKEKQKHQKLQKITSKDSILVIKNRADQRYDYKYREEENIKRIKTINDLQIIIQRLIDQHKQKGLSQTDKFLLSGYLSMYLKEKLSKINRKLSQEEITKQLEVLKELWKLFQFKIIECDEMKKEGNGDLEIEKELKKIWSEKNNRQSNKIGYASKLMKKMEALMMKNL